MQKKVREVLRRMREARETDKEIKALITKKDKNIKIIFYSIALGLFLVLLVGACLDNYNLAGPIFLILICYLCPCACITYRIDKRALEKYKAKYVWKILEFCPHCGEKIEQQTNYCESCGKVIDQKQQEMEEKNGLSEHKKGHLNIEDFEEAPKLLPESLEIVNISRRGVFYAFFIMGFIYSVLFGILFSFLFENESDLNILQFFLLFAIIFSIVMSGISIFIDYLTLHVKFRLSHKAFEMLLENHLYLGIKWNEINSLELYKVIFQGFFLKINLEDSFRIIPFKILQLSNKKKEKIFDAIRQYSIYKGIKISREERLQPILKNRGRNLLQEEITKFSRRHKYKRSSIN